MNDIEGHLHGLLNLPRAIGDNDRSWKHALRKHRSNGRSEESKVMLRGDRRSHGHIDVLPMRIRSAVQHIGHDCLDIAAGVRIHNLSVRTGRTMPSSPFLVLFL